MLTELLELREGDLVWGGRQMLAKHFLEFGSISLKNLINPRIKFIGLGPSLRLSKSVVPLLSLPRENEGGVREETYFFVDREYRELSFPSSVRPFR